MHALFFSSAVYNDRIGIRCVFGVANKHLAVIQNYWTFSLICKRDFYELLAPDDLPPFAPLGGAHQATCESKAVYCANQLPKMYSAVFSLSLNTFSRQGCATKAVQIKDKISSSCLSHQFKKPSHMMILFYPLLAQPFAAFLLFKNADSN
jgi:hypothetical protein